MLRAAVLAFLSAVVGAGSALGASGADTFRMPSGNIYCTYEHYSFAPKDLRCEIRTGVRPLPPKCDADWGAGFTLRQIGLAHILCAGDTIYDPKARVLAYGQTWHGGGFTCESKRGGLRCLNPRGHGFFLSKEHSYAFTEPAPRNGAFKTPSGNIVCGYSIAPSGDGRWSAGSRAG